MISSILLRTKILLCSIEERIYNVEPGEYSLRFSNFNLNYDCPTFLEDITMSEGDKLKIEYQCKKED